MSRYSKKELDKVKKVELLELVRRQPDIVFPAKIGSGPLDLLTAKQLRAALAGPHGYVKPPAAVDTVDGNENSLSRLPSPLTSSGFEKTAGPEVGQLVTSVRAVSLNTPEPEDHMDFVADGAPLLGEDDISMDDTVEGSVSDVNLPKKRVKKVLQSSSPDDSEDDEGDIDVNLPKSKKRVKKVLQSSSPDDSEDDEGDIFESYPDKTKADNVLLNEYFAKHGRLRTQLEIMREHRGKHQSDQTLVLDYQFNIKLYKTLMDHRWQNSNGRILGKDICKYLDISPPWLAKARRVVELVDRLGPDSPNPDPLVVARLSSKATTNKGEDFLKFLKERAAAI